MAHTVVALSRVAAEIFVSGLWQGLVLIAVTALALRMLSRAAASIRFALWTFAFALVVAVPLLPLRPVAATAAPEHGFAAHAGTLHLGAEWGIAVAVLWAFVSAVRGAQLLHQARELRRVFHRAQPVAAAPAILSLLRPGHRTAELCTSTDVQAPSVVGFVSPRLLIPAALFPTLTEADLREIVLHECEHLRRGDDWINLLQKIGLALFPLNPALLWVDRRLSLERELACDAGVVRRTAAPFRYAGSLTRLAEFRLRSRSLALSLSAWGRRSELAARVQTLLEPARSLSSGHARSLVALLGLGLAAGSVELARAPQLVSFTEPDRLGSPVAPTGPAGATTGTAPNHTAPRTAVPSTSASPASAVVVSYHPAGQPHATLLNAVMPVPSPSSSFANSLDPRSHRARRTARGGARSASLPPYRTEPQTDIQPQTERQTEPQTDSQTERQTHIARTRRPIGRTRLMLTSATATTRAESSSALADVQPRFGEAPQSDTAGATVQTRRRRHTAAPRPVLTLATDFSSSFAAVPFGDGWLIIQL